MIIDGHAHAAREFSNIETLIKELSINGVDKVVLCPSLKNRTNIPNPPSFFKGKRERDVKKLFAGNPIITFICSILKQQGDSNEFVHTIQQQAPDRVIQFYWVDFNSPTVLAELPLAVTKYRCGGLKLHQAWTPFECDSPRFESVISFAAEHRLPLFIHPGSEEELVKLREAALQHPDTPFIISHLMGIDVFKGYEGENIYHDISPEDLLTDNIYRAVNDFGAERVIFGSDMPFGDLGENIRKVQALNLTDEQRELILGGNMKRLLRL